MKPRSLIATAAFCLATLAGRATTAVLNEPPAATHHTDSATREHSLIEIADGKFAYHSTHALYDLTAYATPLKRMGFEFGFLDDTHVDNRTGRRSIVIGMHKTCDNGVEIRIVDEMRGKRDGAYGFDDLHRSDLLVIQNDTTHVLELAAIRPPNMPEGYNYQMRTLQNPGPPGAGQFMGHPLSHPRDLLAVYRQIIQDPLGTAAAYNKQIDRLRANERRSLASSHNKK